MANFSMPWVEADFRRKTAHLTRVQRDAYRSLLHACFDAGGELPDRDKTLERIVDLDSRTWRKHRPVVLGFFYRTADGWRHQRVDEDIERIASIHKKRSSAGQKGVVARMIKQARRH